METAAPHSPLNSSGAHQPRPHAHATRTHQQERGSGLFGSASNSAPRFTRFCVRCPVGLAAGCEKCDHNGTRMPNWDHCAATRKEPFTPTLDPLYRSANRNATPGSKEDIWKFQPWRSPGNQGSRVSLRARAEPFGPIGVAAASMMASLARPRRSVPRHLRAAHTTPSTGLARPAQAPRSPTSSKP